MEEEPERRGNFFELSLVTEAWVRAIGSLVSFNLDRLAPFNKHVDNGSIARREKPGENRHPRNWKLLLRDGVLSFGSRGTSETVAFVARSGRSMSLWHPQSDSRLSEKETCERGIREKGSSG